MTKLEVLTTKIKWPRGLAFVDEELHVLARGLHRSDGGPNHKIEDHAGSIFKVDKSIRDQDLSNPGQSVADNGVIVAPPTDAPFYLWDKNAEPKFLDRRTDRPYATLAYEPITKNFFICGYSGIDFRDSENNKSFRKNANDTIHRYSLEKQSWFGVECHNRQVVPEYRLGLWIKDSEVYYPHHDISKNPPPHGFLNGPDGLAAHHPFLFAVAKDNNVLVSYDILNMPDVGFNKNPFLNGKIIKSFGDKKVRVKGIEKTISLLGPSGVAVSETEDGYFVYVSFRTTSKIVRYHVDGATQEFEPIPDLIADFSNADVGKGVDIIDIQFNQAGELFTSTAKLWGVWNVGIPNPQQPFMPDNTLRPTVDLQDLTGSDTKCSNIAFDSDSSLYICSGFKGGSVFVATGYEGETYLA